MAALNGQSILRLACWEAHRGPVSGWPEEKLDQVMGKTGPRVYDTWPPAARGLPLGERKKLSQFGLHRLDTQFCLAVSNVLRRGSVDVDELRQWMVDGFERQVWRGADRRILEITHNYRVKRGPAQTLQAATCLGPIFVGLALAVHESLSVADVVRQTVRVAQTVYQSDETSVVAGYVAAAVRTGRGHWMSPAIQPEQFISEGVAQNTFEALTQPHSRIGGVVMSSARTIIGRIDSFMSAANDRRTFNTSDIDGLPIQVANYLNTLAHVLDDARSNENALPIQGLTDRTRLEAYARSMANADTPCESADIFFDSEYALSQKERIYQESMAAERRH